MSKEQFYKKWSAIVLLGVFLSALLHQTYHRLEDSHCHSELKSCQLEIDAPTGTHHFHDDHYLTDDCSLCDFFIQTLNPPSAPELPSRSLLPLFLVKLLWTDRFWEDSLQQVLFLRGPPLT